MYKGKIAVRKIVEFILRRGDIDSRKVSNHTAQEGARIHRRLQKKPAMPIKRKSFQNRKRDRKGQVNYRRTCRRLIL